MNEISVLSKNRCVRSSFISLTLNVNRDYFYLVMEIFLKLLLKCEGETTCENGKCKGLNNFRHPCSFEHSRLFKSYVGVILDQNNNFHSSCRESNR